MESFLPYAITQLDIYKRIALFTNVKSFKNWIVETVMQSEEGGGLGEADRCHSREILKEN